MDYFSIAMTKYNLDEVFDNNETKIRYVNNLSGCIVNP